MLRALMGPPSRTTLRTRLVEQVRATVGGLPGTYWLLWTGTLVNRLGAFVVPFLALYLTRERGFSEEQAGLVAALYGAGAVVSGPLGGTLADRFGRRTALALGLWLGSAGMIFLGFSREPMWIRVAAFTLGIVGEMYRPAVSAAIADVVPPQDRTRAFGLLYWVVNVGFSIALPLAGLVSRSGFLLLFLVDALTTFLYGCIVWFKFPETLPQRSASNSVLPSLAPFWDKTFLNFWLPTFLMALIFFQMNVALALDLGARGMSPAQFGLALSANGVLIVLVQPFVGRFVSHWRRSAVLAGAAVFTGVGFGLHVLSFNVPLAMMAVVVWTVGEILNAAVAPSVVTDLAPPALRGSYQGAFHMSWGLAACVAPVLGSQVLGRFGGITLWSGCLLVGLIAAAWHLLVADARRRHMEVLRTRHEGVSESVD
ncbi:MDR family MFS transporter [Hyalangium rubrum]|uniref:MFS transporter n=1 Tax=Hyalangium rubrum TaxID=3103134 RepID=A0ABU5HJH0_9BACT|nr:MFS transporter [Hyalangium sp. s54d21]MDY7232240.1 MFS transporter [Hyalangium sp. s54d21]